MPTGVPPRDSGDQIVRFQRVQVPLLLATVVGLCCGAPAPAQDSQGSSNKIDLSYIDSRFVAGFVLRPKQILQSPLGRNMIATAFQENEYQQATAELSREFGLNPADATQVAVLLTERNIAAMNGIEMSDAGRGPGARSREAVNNLRNLALAFHNYHDVWKRFPGTTRPGQGKLSWRVHILPYVEQINLYEQFDLDEDWDSDTNKPLLKKMPAIFRTADSGDTTTTVHITELGFPDEGPNRFRDVTDGTSNTVMHVIAGGETAAEWTKPGRLEISKDDPWESMGRIRRELLVSMMDGSFRKVPRKTDSKTLLAMLTRNGGEPVDLDMSAQRARNLSNPYMMPTLVVHSAKVIDQDGMIELWQTRLGEPVKRKGNGQDYFDFSGFAVWFPTDKSVVAAPTATLPRLMANRNTASSFREILTRNSWADFVAVGDVKGMPVVSETMFEVAGGFYPKSFQRVEVGSLVANLTKSDRPLAEAIVQTSDEKSAIKIRAMVNGVWAVLTDMDETFTENAPAEIQQAFSVVLQLIENTQATRDGTSVVYSIPKPGKGDVAAAMEPYMEELGQAFRAQRERARVRARMGNLKQIGLAFHNHHDVYNSFGAANGSTPDGRKAGLSWRVHLLPFLEHSRLYDQFKLDEPWDSEHNKKLIAKMPDVFKVKGLEEPGKTSIHVLTGKSRPFGDGTTAFAINDCIDGTSNTILAIQAGTDTAAIWTKPGGLECDLKNPIKALGTLGDRFLALFADGSVHDLSKDLDSAILRALMTNAGREVIGYDDF